MTDIYRQMIGRCYNKNNKRYHDYGGRGITVSEDWRLSKNNFLNDMGKRPTNKHSLDRIDNDKGYSKENCRWATIKQQSKNKRSTVNLVAFGKTKCIADWSRLLKISKGTIRYRLSIGKTHEECLTIKPKKSK